LNRRSVTKTLMKSSLESTVQEVLQLLDADDGKSFEEKKKEAIAILRKQTNPSLAGTLVDFAVADVVGKQVKARFWEAGPIKCPDYNIVLRQIEDDDRDCFISLQEENSYIRDMLNEESYRNALWKDHCGEKSLMLSIILDDQYIGYCGIKNTAQEPWEIAIELYKKWTNHGLGRIAISAMLDAMVIRLGVRQFRVRIDPSNHASQKLFEKMGAQPNGVSEYLILDQKELEKVEKENLNLIDAATVALADKFGVEPRKLLSHVLEYTLSW